MLFVVVVCCCCCFGCGCRLLVVGFGMLAVGCWLLVVGCWLLVVGCFVGCVAGCWLLLAQRIILLAPVSAFALGLRQHLLLLRLVGLREQPRAFQAICDPERALDPQRGFKLLLLAPRTLLQAARERRIPRSCPGNLLRSALAVRCPSKTSLTRCAWRMPNRDAPAPNAAAWRSWLSLVPTGACCLCVIPAHSIITILDVRPA